MEVRTGETDSPEVAARTQNTQLHMTSVQNHSCLDMFVGERDPIHSDEGTLGLESGGSNTYCENGGEGEREREAPRLHASS